MKNKTLALITATLITVAALVLTSSLSLLSSAAITESAYEGSAVGSYSEAPIENGEAAPVPDGVIENGENYPVIEDEPNPDEQPTDAPAFDEENTPPEAENAPLDEESVTPEATPEVTPDTVYPEFSYQTGNAKDIYIGGGTKDGVVIDVYSHKTGKLVGQLAFTSEAICSYISQLKSEEFKPENELWIEEKISCVPLPEGDYRIEVYAGTWFSYTYGVSGIFELTQCTLTFKGGEKLTGFIDSLISGYIAEIEAGNVAAPDPEMAVSKLEYGGLEGYWEGYYNDVCNMYIPGAGRWCERFPYISEE